MEKICSRRKAMCKPFNLPAHLPAALFIAPILLSGCGGAAPATDPFTYNQADVNASQTLDIHEYHNMIAAKASAGGKSAREIMSLGEAERNEKIYDQFRKLDENGDGFLSREELSVE